MKKTYNDLNEAQKAEARGILREEWLKDAREERERFPRDPFIEAIIANLEENNDAAREMIDDAIENKDFVKTYTLADGTQAII